MSITFVQADYIAEATTDTSTAITWSSDTTTGNCVIVCVFWKGSVLAVISGIADSQSNSYADCGLGKLTRPSDGFMQILGASTITGGTTPTVTVTWDIAVSDKDVYVLEYSGQDSADFFQEGNTGTATTGTVVTASSFTPSVSDGAVIAFAAGNSATGADVSFSDGVGYTNRELNATVPWGQGVADRIFTSSPGAISPACTFPNSVTKAAIMAVAIKAAAGGISIPPYRPRVQYY